MSTPPTGPTATGHDSGAPAVTAPASPDAPVVESRSVAGKRPGTWPEQLRLPGQVAAPDGPLELAGMFLMHHAFRRDVTAFVSAVSRTPIGERATWKALGKRWSRLGNVLHKHHSVEDTRLWPPLLERARRAGDENAVATLQAMAEEHDAIYPLLVSCSAAFSRLASALDERVRAGLVADVGEFRDLLLAHLAHEEQEALAVVQHHLTVEEWTAFEAEIGKDDKPWDIPFALCWVLKGLPDDAREVVFGLPGTPPRRAWNVLRPGFDRRERRAFRYAAD